MIIRSLQLTTLFLLAALAPAWGQQTGSFTEMLTFNGESRILSYYVPADYDSTASYQLLVGLHGLGDNSTSYRNALINSRDWKQHFPNTIFIFPDGGTDPNSDYYAPSGDEGFIAEAIDHAVDNYSINNDRIILQGFSLGGRSALKYGLAHPQVFYGLLLNTPALQGVADAMNDTLAAAGPAFQYQNADQLPIYIINGGEDYIYLSSIREAFEQLVRNDGKVWHRVIPGMAHTFPQFSEMNNVLDFFADPALAPVDAGLVEVNAPQRSCNPELDATLLFRNTGASPLTAVDFSYTVAGQTKTFQWTGQLDSYEHAEVSLPADALPYGDHQLQVSISDLNGTVADTVQENNTASTAFIFAEEGQPLPLMESFEGATFPPADWVIEPSGNVSPWDFDTETASDGQNSVYSFNTILLFYNIGAREEILTPLLDLTTAQNPQLQFDIAYNYHKYTPPYLIDTFLFADTLEVAISTDCGATFNMLFKEGGEDLSTFDEPLLNVLNIPAAFITPDSSDWETITIELDDYASAENAIIRFTYISAQGGSIYMDKVVVEGGTSLQEQPENRFALKTFPNPTTGMVTVRANGVNVQQVNVYDLSGKKVFTQQISGASNTSIPLNLHSLQSGSYILEAVSEDQVGRQKLFIVR